MTPLETLVNSPLDFALNCTVEVPEGYVAHLNSFKFTSIKFQFPLTPDMNSFAHLYEKLKDIELVCNYNDDKVVNEVFHEELKLLSEVDQTNNDNCLRYIKQTGTDVGLEIEYKLTVGNMEQHPSYRDITEKHRELVMSVSEENPTKMPFVPGGYSITVKAHKENPTTLFGLDRTLFKPVDLSVDYNLRALMNHISYVLVKSLLFTIDVGKPTIEDISLAVQTYLENTVITLEQVIEALTDVSVPSDNYVFTNEQFSLTLLKEI